MLFVISILLATTAYIAKPLRFIMASLAMVLMGVSAGLLFSDNANLWGVLFISCSLFQILNIARLIDTRLHNKYLRNAFFIGGGRLFVMQATLLVLQKLNPNVMWLLTSTQLLVAVCILLLVVRQVFKSRPINVKHFLSDHELPSISVLIPARNEDKNLEDLLRTLIANDYPKLEILVLDDCSVGKNISIVVKQFAHDGVRFIQGATPKSNWLAKNQAYETLADQASGEWLIFMGVDVRLGVGSLRGLVHYAINNEKTMLSIVPRRSGATFWSGFFSPLRYFREFTKPGILNFSVPALSTAWIIKKNTYRELGGIESVARKVIPEHYFAKKLNSLKEYAFVRTNDYLQISTSKSLSEQLATSVRVIYPSLHRQMELVFLSSIAMLLFLLLPFVELVLAIRNGDVWSFGLSLGVVACLTLCHLIIVGVTNPVLWPLAVVNFPYLVAQEIVLGIVSMCRYEFGEINWKGRNVCLPVMHVIPHLPPMVDRSKPEAF